MTSSSGDAPPRAEPLVPTARTHPFVFLILMIPLGMSSGYVTVTLAYLLSHAGISVMAVAGLAALVLMPQNIKFLWAPLVDTTLTRKRWYVISALLMAAAFLVTALMPMGSGYLFLFQVMAVVLSTLTTFNAMATDALMAHATSLEEKGRAGGWSQAGNLGGAGLGGGAALWIATHVQATWLSGAVLGVACILTSIALLWVDEPEVVHRTQKYRESLVEVGRECWDMVRSRLGFLAIFIMLVPIGSGGAMNLWPAIAGDWHAGADMVALVNGMLGGVVTMVGCVAGGFISDWMDRKAAYCTFGLVVASCAVLMAFAPRTPAMFAGFTLAYAFCIGLCYAGFGAITLEAIGGGAAATKYNVIAGLSNLPLLYAALIDGWAQTRFGSGGMLKVDALLGVLAVALYAAIAMLTRGRFLREKPTFEGA